jgi:hypothetical protein
MKSIALAVCLTALILPTASAGSQLDFEECTVRSDYGLRVHGGSVLLNRKSGDPREVRIQEGRLWLDGAEQMLGQADRQRLRHIERELTAMLPEVRAIAEEGLDMAIDALVHVAGSLGVADPALIDEIERARQDFSQAIERQMQGDGLDEGLMEHDIEALVERLTPQIAGKVAALAISAALSGDEAAAKDFERRAETMGKELEVAMKSRGKALESRAEALCGRIERIDMIENALDLRLADGSPLNLVRM